MREGTDEHPWFGLSVAEVEVVHQVLQVLSHGAGRGVLAALRDRVDQPGVAAERAARKGGAQVERPAGCQLPHDLGHHHVADGAHQFAKELSGQPVRALAPLQPDLLCGPDDPASLDSLSGSIRRARTAPRIGSR